MLNTSRNIQSLIFWGPATLDAMYSSGQIGRSSSRKSWSDRDLLLHFHSHINNFSRGRNVAILLFHLKPYEVYNKYSLEDNTSEEEKKLFRNSLEYNLCSGAVLILLEKSTTIILNDHNHLKSQSNQILHFGPSSYGFLNKISDVELTSMNIWYSPKGGRKSFSH